MLCLFIPVIKDLRRMMKVSGGTHLLSTKALFLIIVVACSSLGSPMIVHHILELSPLNACRSGILCNCRYFRLCMGYYF